jgi:hypothetical protein
MSHCIDVGRPDDTIQSLYPLALITAATTSQITLPSQFFHRLPWSAHRSVPGKDVPVVATISKPQVLHR